jgi:two-component system, cell cycle response regulator
MRTGGQTTVIRRVLERRAQKPPAIQDDTTATIAVMLRVLPPPRGLVCVADAGLQAKLESSISAEMLELESFADDTDALESFDEEFAPVIITDSLHLIRSVRLRKSQHTAFIIYIAELDEADEREAGLRAGADECIGRRVSDAEMSARIAAGRRIAELEAVLRIALVENRELSTTDELTRVASRRFFSKHFPREVERASRYGRALSLILCDIDFFKSVNDSLGHAGGDEVLKQFGARLQAALRRGVDWVARLGGEEFAVILPETGYDAALEVARKLRACVAAPHFQVQSRKVNITASFGLCGLNAVPSTEKKIPDRLLKVADAALYRSKDAGRNRVTATMLPASGRGARRG